MATLLLVGHGSRDPRSPAQLRDLTARVARARPELDVRVAFLELSLPSLEDVLAEVSGEVVVVPLLLAAAFHARSDLPGRLAAAAQTRADLRLIRTEVLGPHPLLDAAVTARSRELASRGCDGVVLLGTGSSHPPANAAAQAVAARVSRASRTPVETGFVTAAPSVEDAVGGLRRCGATRIGVVPWFLAPGRLLDAGLDRARALGADPATATLASDPRLVELVLARRDRAGKGAGLPG